VRLRSSASDPRRDEVPSTVDEVKNLIRERDFDGMLQKLRESGLEEQVSSWIAKGQNMPVVGAQIKKALGNEKVAEIASKLGLTTEQAADDLAQSVPEVVDEVTPDGELPTPEQVEERLERIP
jgi:uncharacterized protein YidB (DUF937 family)